MKTLFIPAKIKSEINEKKILKLSEKLPKNIAITYSIQYQDIAFKIKQVISTTHKITKLIQVLGCSSPVFSKETQAILLIGSGRFHALSLAVKTKLPVYILNRDNLEKISEKEIASFKAKKKASYLRFLNSDKIGILLSTKPGQQNLKKALEIKNNFNSKNKKTYLFIGDNFNSNEFENFNISSYINTACPRLDMDFPVVNQEELLNL